MFSGNGSLSDSLIISRTSLSVGRKSSPKNFSQQSILGEKSYYASNVCCL
nr:MAG TPA: hypothetical protein [Ackermannviridae sp.]